ncbi:hypothetical protein ACFL6C_12190 [Myxococcota bacterium]
MTKEDHDEQIVHSWIAALRMRFESLQHALASRFVGVIQFAASQEGRAATDICFFFSLGGKETKFSYGCYAGKPTAAVTIDVAALTHMMSAHEHPGTVFQVSGDFDFYTDFFRAMRATESNAMSPLGVRSAHALGR